MGFLILWFVIFALASLLLELIGSLLMDGLIRLGQRAFRTRADGTFSRWQIAGQIVIVGPVAMICLIEVAWCVFDVAKKMIGS